MKALALRVLIAIAASLAGLAPAKAEWLRAESPNFIVYSQGREEGVRRQILLLEDYHQLLRLLTGARNVASANRLPVYIVRGHDQLRVARPVAANVDGYYFASATGIAAFTNERTEGDANEVLLHEYAHHFMMQYFPSAYPDWYVEGFAEYLMTARFTPTHIDFARYSNSRAGWLGTDWLPMERVLRSDQGADAEDAARFYAQSWLTVHYFFADAQRMAALQRYLAAYARGEDAIAAFERETGLTPAQLQRELRQYMQRRTNFKRLTRPSEAAPPPVRVTRLPRSADDLLLLEAALRIGPREGTEQAYLQRIRTAAARHPNDSYARRVKAHAEALYGDPAVADALLAELLAAEPSEAELHYIAGRRHFRAAEDADDAEPHLQRAQQAFVRANQANPNHVPTLYYYGLSLHGDTDFYSEDTAAVLLHARNLAPQSGDVTLLAAQALVGRRRYAEAEALLRPLAAGAHGGGGEGIRQLLDEVRVRRERAAAGGEESAHRSRE